MSTEKTHEEKKAVVRKAVRKQKATAKKARRGRSSSSPEIPEGAVLATPEDAPEGAAAMRMFYLHVDQIELNRWNTNYMTHEQFQNLVEEIQARGFCEPLKVVPTEAQTAGGLPLFRVIRGEHRLRAVRILKFTYVPCTIGTEEDELEQKIDTVRGNVIRGQQDQGRFSALFDEVKHRKGVTEEELRREMGLTRERFEMLYRTRAERADAEAQEMEADLQGVEGRRRAIENVNVLLHEIFSEFGDDLEFGFIGFLYGGQVHYMLPMSAPLKETMAEFAGACRQAGVEMPYALNEILTGRLAMDELESGDVEGETGGG